MTAGEALGFVPLDGWSVFFILLKTLVVVMIPGYLLSFALFPKKDDLETSERFAMAFILGLTPIFFMMVLNIGFEFKVTPVTDLFVFLIVSAIGLLGYLYRGGTIMGRELLKAYRAG